jgi:hypothetical protein
MMMILQKTQIVNLPMRTKKDDFMLMAIEELEPNCSENDMDAEVDMEGELICALEEIDRLRIKKRKQKQLLI